MDPKSNPHFFIQTILNSSAPLGYSSYYTSFKFNATPADQPVTPGFTLSPHSDCKRKGKRGQLPLTPQEDVSRIVPLPHTRACAHTTCTLTCTHTLAPLRAAVKLQHKHTAPLPYGLRPPLLRLPVGKQPLEKRHSAQIVAKRLISLEHIACLITSGRLSISPH